MSFINDVTARTINLPVLSFRDEIFLASSSKHCRIVEQYVADLTIQGKKYKQIALGLLKDLCTDLLLDGDFQKQHKRVVIHFDNNSRPYLVVSKSQHLSAVAAGDVKPANPFNNLARSVDRLQLSTVVSMLKTGILLLMKLSGCIRQV